jgi:hypothetical protein
MSRRYHRTRLAPSAALFIAMIIFMMVVIVVSDFAASLNDNLQ